MYNNWKKALFCGSSIRRFGNSLPTPFQCTFKGNLEVEIFCEIRSVPEQQVKLKHCNYYKLMVCTQCNNTRNHNSIILM